MIFLVLAVILAAIAVITDSAVLVVGAMVVGPEFAAVAAASAGIVLLRGAWSWRSLRLLVLCSPSRSPWSPCSRWSSGMHRADHARGR